MTLTLIVGLVLNAIALPLAAKRAVFLYRLISSGQPAPDRIENVTKRTVKALSSQLTEVLGQKKLLKWSVPGTAHAFVMYAFFILASVYLEAYAVLLSRNPEWNWFIFGNWSVLGFAQDLISVLCLIGLATFTWIRVKNAPEKLGRKSRFKGSHLSGAWITLFMIFNVIWTLFLFRGAVEARDMGTGHGYGKAAFVSYLLGKVLPDSTLLIGIGLILHLGVMLVFLIFVLNSKHLHIFIAPLNVMFKRPDGPVALGAVKPMMSEGKMLTLEDVEEMDEDTKLGVGSIEDFSWKGLLDMATCTECGRCQSQCPAWNTEKPLSPKLLIMNLRDHAFTAAPYLLADESKRDSLSDAVKAEAARPLVGATEGEAWHPTGGAVIDDDVLWSCTNCGACVNQCPVDIEHVDHIVDMRRYQVLVESNFPAELNGLFKGLENKGNPWNMNPNARMEWAQGLPFDVKVVGEDVESLDDVEWLFWVGCAGAYEDRSKKTTRAVAELLDMADVSFAVLGNGETCTGDPARRAGNEFVFQGLAQQNIEVLTETKAKKVVSTCPHCMNTIKNEYRQFGLELEVVHHTQLLNRLVREKKLTPVAAPAGSGNRSLTYHDPCFLGRHNQVYAPPRELLEVIPDAELKEMPRNSERSFCCGAGGARMWMEETIGERVNVNRTREAVETGADQIAVGCPFCRVMLSDGLVEEQSAGRAREEVEVLDVAQLLLASVKGEAPVAKASSPKKAAVAAEPSAKDATQTESTITETADAGPAAKASGGGSLFDTPAPEKPAEKPAAKPAESGGSLFDTPAPEASKPAAAKPAESGGSLFDVAPTETAKAEPAATKAPEAEKPAEAKAETGGGSLFDFPSPGQQAPTPSEKAQAEAVAEEKPVTSEPENAPTAAEAKEAGTAPTPGTEIGSGSLFDIAAPEGAPTEAKAAEPVETEADAGDEASDEGGTAAEEPAAPEEKPKPASTGEAHQPATDKKIPEGGSLFDL
ncbi:MAG TPA: heterodisulfide reductase-related iron-sulfur binding cluster [Marmoricola sp.]|nr:heterodisulfide reductase-related iron-sulfur binding cluster [Marmoricola sp.]